MSKEKQIEEMARTLCGEMERSCEKCNPGLLCEFLLEAQVLYNAGYRKQSEGRWEKRTFIIFDSEKVGYRCSECNTTWDVTTNYCHNCGAKMKGGE